MHLLYILKQSMIALKTIFRLSISFATKEWYFLRDIVSKKFFIIFFLSHSIFLAFGCRCHYAYYNLAYDQDWKVFCVLYSFLCLPIKCVLWFCTRYFAFAATINCWYKNSCQEEIYHIKLFLMHLNRIYFISLRNRIHRTNSASKCRNNEIW